MNANGLTPALNARTSLRCNTIGMAQTFQPDDITRVLQGTPSNFVPRHIRALTEEWSQKVGQGNSMPVLRAVQSCVLQGLNPEAIVRMRQTRCQEWRKLVSRHNFRIMQEVAELAASTRPAPRRNKRPSYMR